MGGQSSEQMDRRKTRPGGHVPGARPWAVRGSTCQRRLIRAARRQRTMWRGVRLSLISTGCRRSAPTRRPQFPPTDGHTAVPPGTLCQLPAPTHGHSRATWHTVPIPGSPHTRAQPCHLAHCANSRLPTHTGTAVPPGALCQPAPRAPLAASAGAAHVCHAGGRAGCLAPCRHSTATVRGMGTRWRVRE
jgi:hypothetical protein